MYGIKVNLYMMRREEQDEVFTHGWTWTISARIA